MTTIGTRGTSRGRVALVVSMFGVAAGIGWWWGRHERPSTDETRRTPVIGASSSSPTASLSASDAPATPAPDVVADAADPSRVVEPPPAALAPAPFETHSIHGVVVAPDGTAIANATVQAITPENLVYVAVATDARGAFAFEALPTFANCLHVTAAGRGSKVVALDATNHWQRFERVQEPARIVLEAGAIAVARLRWNDGAPCVGVAVQVAAAADFPEGAASGPGCGPWPPLKTDDDGRVVLSGLPPDRLVGLNVDPSGRNRYRTRVLESGHAMDAASAVEQTFAFARIAKLTVALNGLDALAVGGVFADVSLSRTDRDETYRTFSPMFREWTFVFDQVELGAAYSIHLAIPEREHVLLAEGLRIRELDQRATFDCTPPSKAPPAEVAPSWDVHLGLRDLDGSPVTARRLLDLGLWPCDLRVDYGSLVPGTRDDAPHRTDVSLSAQADGELGGQAWLHTTPPLWIEAGLLDVRARVEVPAPPVTDRFELKLDLTRLASSAAPVTFRARDESARPCRLDAVYLISDATAQSLSALAESEHEALRRVPIGRWRYHAYADGSRLAFGDLDVRSVEPITVDLVLRDCGAIRGVVAPMPEASKVEVTRSPVDRPRTRFEWWGGTFVDSEGGFELTGVPPGDWLLMLKSTSPDGKTTRIETATVTVRPDALTRHDFAPVVGPLTKFQVDLGSAESAFVHAEDERGRTTLDAFVRTGRILALTSRPARFRATPRPTDGSSPGFGLEHWTDGVVTLVDESSADPVARLRFEFPTR